MKYTESQQKAISSRARRIIVSAAAGSGKTAVLTRRVMELITDPVDPVSVGSLVIVTFTNAAAAELRSRIASAIGEALAEDPGNMNLIRQSAMLSSARIQTIHSLCLSLIRENFDACGIEADVSLGDEGLCASLKSRAMDMTLEKAFSEEDDAFLALAAALRDERSDRPLSEAVENIYEKLRSDPDPEGWLRRAVDMGANPEGLMKTACEDALKALRESVSLLSSTFAELALNPVFFPKYKDAFEYCIGFAARLEPLLAPETWDEAAELLSGFKCPAFKPVRTTDNVTKERMTAARDGFKALITSLSGGSFRRSRERILTEEITALPMVSALCDLVRDYEKTYSELKRASNILDYSDLEHMTVKLLTENGGLSALGRSLASGISEVLVDEYQDINSLQETILSALASEGRYFMVGDVKQSIYRFRLAEPGIFLGKYYDYPEEGMDPEKASISLNENFRSAPTVIDFTNRIFSSAMTREFGDVEYAGREELRAGAPYLSRHPAEVHLVNIGAKSDEESSAMAEARYAASVIEKLCGTLDVTDDPFGGGKTRRAEPGDFAILLSSFASKAPYYSEALEERGIPCDHGSDLFALPEVLTMISLLRVIDNRRQDVPLLAVLRSPLFGFTADELADIRIASRRSCIYDCLEKSSLPKAKAFTALLNELRREAAYTPVTTLLDSVFRLTSAEAVWSRKAGGNGLSALRMLAAEYESAEAGGLYGFIAKLDRMSSGESKIKLPGKPGVKLMSIHHSKGLEFPVVVLPDMAKRYNSEDIKSPVLFHTVLGIAIRLREGRTNISTLRYELMASRLTSEARSEELRKLYVAATRAKEKLVFTMGVKNPEKTVTSWAQMLGRGFTPSLCAAQSSFALFVGGTALTHPCGDKLRKLSSHPVTFSGDESGLECHVSDPPLPMTVKKEEKRRSTVTGISADAELAFKKYPHAEAASLPSKLTPTGVRKPPEDGGEAAEEGIREYRRQRFSTKGSIRSAKIGTLTHALMVKFRPGESPDEEEIRSVLNAMVTSGEADEATAGAVDTRAVAAFWAGETARRIARADKYLREYQFGLLFTPKELYGTGTDEEQVLVNGAMDIMFIEGDRVNILDFKTDRVIPGTEKGSAEKHRFQLEVYMKAALKLTGLKPGDMLVCFLATGNVTAL